MQPSVQRVKVARDVYLSVRRWPGARRPFLLVHGLSSNARLWDEVASDLAARDHPVTAVDLRSHGESDAPPGGYDTATAADDLAALADAEALGLAGAVVAGQSWGGNVVVELAARHPGVASALALVDGGGIDLPAAFGSWEACETALRPPDIDGLPAQRLRGYISDAHPDWSTSAIDATEANLRVWPDGTLTRRLSIPRHMQILRSMWDNPPSRWYPAIDVPVLLMPALPADPGQAAGRLAQMDAVAGALANGRVRPYPASDHDLHAQHPHEVAGDLLELADRIGG